MCPDILKDEKCSISGFSVTVCYSIEVFFFSVNADIFENEIYRLVWNWNALV